MAQKQLNLFHFDDLIYDLEYVPLEELRSCVGDIDWVKSHSKKINLMSRDVIAFFEKQNNLTVERCPQYYCSPYWGEATKNYKWRYMIVGVKERRFLVFLRLVGIMYDQQYFSLSYEILSSDGNKDKIEDVTKAVCNLPCIKSVETISDKNNEECVHVNYYCDKKNALSMNKNRRNKYKRSLSLFDYGLRVMLVNNANFEDFEKKAEMLYGTFIKKRFSFNVNSARNMLKMAIDNPNDCYVYGFYINDVLIGTQMACNDFMNSISVHFAKDITSFDVESISEYVGVDRVIAQRIKNFFGTYEECFLKEKFLVEKEYDAVFVDGYRIENSSSMSIHKNGFYPKKVSYKIIKV